MSSNIRERVPFLNKYLEIVQKNFSYNADENKFKFKEYQDKIEKNLIDTIIEDVIIHLTY